MAIIKRFGVTWRDVEWRDVFHKGWLSGDLLHIALGGYLLASCAVALPVTGVRLVAHWFGVTTPTAVVKVVIYGGGGLLDALLVALCLIEEGYRRASVRRTDAQRRAAIEAARKAKPPPPPAQLPLPIPSPKKTPARPSVPSPRRPPPRPARAAPDEDDEPPGGWFRYGDVPENLRPPRRADPRKPSAPAVAPAAGNVDPPLGPGLTEAQWHTLPDARALLRHAIPRIPVRHTALVLSYLAELLFEDWHRERPEDWQVAGCLAVLRAWCFGEASLEEVNALRAEVKRASVEERAPASREESWRCAQRAALATLSASLFAGYARNHDADVGSALVIVDSILSTAREQDPQVRAAKSAVDWARAEAQALTRLNGAINNRVLRSAHVAVEQRVLASVANQLRVWIPYPGRRAQTWERKSETLVCAGDALLTVHGWRILDAHPLPTVPRYPRGGWI